MRVVVTILVGLILLSSTSVAGPVKIGVMLPLTGPFSASGKDQLDGLQLAFQQINQSGGILERPIQFLIKDTKSNKRHSARVAKDLIIKDQVKLLVGGVSSTVALSLGSAAQRNSTLFLSTIAVSNAVTGKGAHRTVFRSSHNSWMGAKALGTFLKRQFSNQRYFYITADYGWGWETESDIRNYSESKDEKAHPRVLAPIGVENFDYALEKAIQNQSKVLVLILFGDDLLQALRQVAIKRLKDKMTIVVPIVDLLTLQKAGPKIAEHIVGVSDWNWKIPYYENSETGKSFVEDFFAAYHRYPSWNAAHAYTCLMQYKAAVEHAESFVLSKVVKKLEDHTFSLLKGEQTWRGFDHQNIQDVYVAQIFPAERIVQNVVGADYFKIIERVPADLISLPHYEWKSQRTEIGLADRLEGL